MSQRSLPDFPPKICIVGLPVNRLPHDTTELLQSTTEHLPGLSMDSRPAVARRYFNCVEEHCPWLRHGQCSSTQEERWGCAMDNALPHKKKDGAAPQSFAREQRGKKVSLLWVGLIAC